MTTHTWRFDVSQPLFLLQMCQKEVGGKNARPHLLLTKQLQAEDKIKQKAAEKNDKKYYGPFTAYWRC